ncbi:MAG: MFS transporter [bacterium]|nr:MFS transporter [bacterium]
MASAKALQSTSIQSWFMWSLASLFYAYQYILRVMPNIMMPQIIEKYQIDASVFGQFTGLYYLGYAGMHIPIGIMLDRIGPRIVLSASIFLTTLGLIPLIYADSWGYPAAGRILIGMGSSGAFLGVFKILHMYFPKRHVIVLLGTSVTIGLIGGIYGGAPVKFLMEAFGWMAVTKVMISIGIVFTIFMYLAIPEMSHKKSDQSTISGDLRAVFTSPMVLPICLFAGLMVGPLEGFADGWATEYLKISYHLEGVKTTTLPSMIFFGMCFGAPFLTYISQRRESYFSTIVLSACIMGAAFLTILFGAVRPNLLFVLFFAIGVSCAYQLPAIYKATTYVPGNVASLTTAVVNMFIMVFGYVFHSAIGRSMDLLWDGKTLNGVPLYSAETFTYALSVIPVGLLIGGVGFFVLHQRDKKHTLKERDNTVLG